MNDIEKAIGDITAIRDNIIKGYNITKKDLKHPTKSCHYRVISLEKAITVLEKQIRKKPNKDDCCPICFTYLKDDNGVEGNYCPNCGQKVNWSV